MIATTKHTKVWEQKLRALRGFKIVAVETGDRQWERTVILEVDAAFVFNGSFCLPTVDERFNDDKGI